MKTEIGGWLEEISSVLHSASLASLSKRLGIPRSTIALRRRYPRTTTLHDLRRMEEAGLLKLHMSSRVEK